MLLLTCLHKFKVNAKNSLLHGSLVGSHNYRKLWLHNFNFVEFFNTVWMILE